MRGGAVSAGAIGEQPGGVLEGLGEEVAGKIVVGRSDIAFHDGRGFSTGSEGGRGGVVGAVSDGGAGVVEGGSTGEGDGGLPEGVVELEDLGAVDALWVLRRRGRALRDVAGREVAGDLAWVELVLERDLHGVAGKGDRAERRYFRIDAGYACNEEVGCSEVEERREDEGGHGGGGVYLCRSSASAFGVHVTVNELTYRFRQSPIDRRFRQRCNGRLDIRVKSPER